MGAQHYSRERRTQGKDKKEEKDAHYTRGEQEAEMGRGCSEDCAQCGRGFRCGSGHGFQNHAQCGEQKHKEESYRRSAAVREASQVRRVRKRIHHEKILDRTQKNSHRRET